MQPILKEHQRKASSWCYVTVCYNKRRDVLSHSSRQFGDNIPEKLQQYGHHNRGIRDRWNNN